MEHDMTDELRTALEAEITTFIHRFRRGEMVRPQMPHLPPPLPPIPHAQTGR
jgi:hypothetical protein